VPINARLSNEEPFSLQGRSLGQGSVVIDAKRDHDQFSRVVINLFKPTLTTLGVSIGTYQWVFAMDGFPFGIEEVMQKCGFAPGEDLPQVAR
jgi:hypothetical protein